MSQSVKEQLEQLELTLGQLTQEREKLNERINGVRQEIRTCKSQISTRSASKREYDKRRRLEIKNTQSIEKSNSEMREMLTNLYQRPLCEVMEIIPRPELDKYPPSELQGEEKSKWKKNQREKFNVELYKWAKDENTRLKLIVGREEMKAKTLKLLASTSELYQSHHKQ